MLKSVDIQRCKVKMQFPDSTLRKRKGRGGISPLILHLRTTLMWAVSFLPRKPYPANRKLWGGS